MHRALFIALFLAPFAVHAADDCKYQAPRNLKLDLSGVRVLQVELHSHDLHLTGSDGTKGAELTGRACASDPKLLDELVVTQHREGDRLVVEAGGTSHSNISLFARSYTNLELNLQVPSQLPIVLNVGSGDAWATGVKQLEGHVGSGELHVSKIAGALITSVGSGDVDANDIGALELGSLGSGALKADGIKGDAKIGSIGSGEVALSHVGGSVHADTLGSGDLTVRDVRGDLSLAAKGSGDVNYSSITGKVKVPRDND
ncbi:DUF4097 family beta strand repeat-containing protein [Dyella tabacisoli]|uniref:DUF4097 domain-containing protein n=1 Tax=Dyella tabacisoli TaxID=2282381 RepID=A0A369UNX6_9GAMM|nr:DUF4097 family beta strand repeat-containing protein [Dyella tabacisoli]RDD82454.1 hypothetical protein DVJ77_05770 [Dyella tabacisoli]